MIVIPEKIIKRLRKDRLTKSLYLTDIGFFPKAKYHFRQRPSGAKENIFIYAINGEGTVEIEEKKYKIIPDHFIIIPANKIPWKFTIPLPMPTKYITSSWYVPVNLHKEVKIIDKTPVITKLIAMLIIDKCEA